MSALISHGAVTAQSRRGQGRDAFVASGRGARGWPARAARGSRSPRRCGSPVPPPAPPAAVSGRRRPPALGWRLTHRLRQSCLFWRGSDASRAGKRQHLRTLLDLDCIIAPAPPECGAAAQAAAHTLSAHNDSVRRLVALPAGEGTPPRMRVRRRARAGARA
jgi:hypothetical protein